MFSTRHLKLIRAYQLAVMYYGREEPKFAEAVERVAFAALSLMPLDLEPSPKGARRSSFDDFLRTLAYPCVEETHNPVYKLFLR